jgi:hypothetical protein
MSHEALKAALEALPDPTHCEGTLALTERFAIALPDGDVGALDDAMFVDWLLAHSEDAPFGHGGETKRDKNVRDANRLVARGKAKITGFDPADVLPAIEAVLSPRTHLDATLVDVIVYPKGGQFAKHKDTPRTPNLVGTLVVGLPIAHEGGQFELGGAGGGEDDDAVVIDWSGSPDPSSVRWVALFSDVDHAVKPVTSGARVTLVYGLSRSDRPRVDATRDQRLAALRAAASAITLNKNTPLLIPCTRLVITDGTQPQAVDTLRGTDREIADVLEECGFTVKVRACLLGSESATPFASPASYPWAIQRLKAPIPQDVIDGMDVVVSFTDDAAADEDYDFESTNLGAYVQDWVQTQSCILRKTSAATKIYEGMYSETGYFGNEASDGLLYTLAALEVTKPATARKQTTTKARTKTKTTSKAKAKTTPKPKAKTKTKPKRR